MNLLFANKLFQLTFLISCFALNTIHSVAQERFDHVFDLDGTLFQILDDDRVDKLSFEDKKRLIRIAWKNNEQNIEQYYLIAPGAQSYLELLSSDPTNYISFFSAGSESRNIALLKAATLLDGRSFYDLATVNSIASPRVFSTQHLSEVAQERGYFKDLEVIEGLSLKRALLYDDSLLHVAPSQRLNHVYVSSYFVLTDGDNIALDFLKKIQQGTIVTRDLHEMWLRKNSYAILKSQWKKLLSLTYEQRTSLMQEYVLRFNKEFYDRIIEFTKTPNLRTRKAVLDFMAQLAKDADRETTVSQKIRAFQPLLSDALALSQKKQWCSDILFGLNGAFRFAEFK